MKANYEKPMIEFEEYEVNTAIATGCGTIVSLGPGDSNHETCAEWDTGFGEFSMDPSSMNFYQGSCSCYLSAGEGTYFTS